jgi:hypothetical protein
VPAVDAAEALAELTEISSQIEAVAIADAEGNVVPTEGVALAAAGGALLERAAQARGREPAQLAATTDRGSVFVVRDGERTIVATTKPDPIASLVLYDLKNCLSNAS